MCVNTMWLGPLKLQAVHLVFGHFSFQEKLFGHYQSNVSYRLATLNT